MQANRQATTIELAKEAMKFSAGHFTIFSASERERLHGHNFTVYAAITGPVDDNGMLTDYVPVKRALFELCAEYNEYFLLPGESPHLRLREEGVMVIAEFNGEDIPFRRGDVRVLPIRNVTVEELARLFTARLVDEGRLGEQVTSLTVKVSSGPGQWGSHRWEAGA
ncbi:MAG: 6-carboxytetrahydropterin synthase [Nannocystaceae bacterium]|nr:6-carboxytetrahydropterin synthase [Myxococcales bacterium]